MRRRDLLAGALSIPMLRAQTGSQATVPSVTDQQGLRLIRRMQAAMGSSDRLAAIHDVDWTVAAKHGMRPARRPPTQYAVSVGFDGMFSGRINKPVVPQSLNSSMARAAGN